MPFCRALACCSALALAISTEDVTSLIQWPSFSRIQLAGKVVNAPRNQEECEDFMLGMLHYLDQHPDIIKQGRRDDGVLRWALQQQVWCGLDDGPELKVDDYFKGRRFVTNRKFEEEWPGIGRLVNSALGNMTGRIDSPPVSHPGRCLNFIHNPRTGGTSIDSVNLNAPGNQRFYHSFMEETLDGATRTPLYLGWRPGPLFDLSHGLELSDESNAEAGLRYGPYLRSFPFGFASWNVPKEYGNFGQKCQLLHTPFAYSSEVQRFFSREDCTTFCIVRDPLHRVLSTYKFKAKGECSQKEFEGWIKRTFPLRSPESFCHLYPQVEYVYRSKDLGARRWCDRVLRFENLTAEYNALMKEFDKDARLDVHAFDTGVCHIDANEISQEAKDLVYDYFKRDYEAFDYPHP